ncbi:hypothetical protein [Vibrio sp. VB16]|uniref:hypothetical protein n=1 Tax=Vibrio sp. VB16 TaxID=2785746 RepID=UPI00189ED8CD|nr:hypothetical protein [Vibrio sp. VB16]UGA57488.1 hypothetical protein IUZ65_018510 [Vibrio sp. VB16]
MFFCHEHLPEQFDDILFYIEEPFQMPSEKAFSASVKYRLNDEERLWKRVWYVSELETKLMEVELEDTPKETIKLIAKEHKHDFKCDISKYLKHNDLNSEINDGVLVLTKKML